MVVKPKAADQAYKLALIAQQAPEQFVLHITYLDRSGNVTGRAVSPIKLEPEGILCYCLGRMDVRKFLYKRIMRTRIQLASEVLCPEAIQELVSHRRTHRKN